MKHHHLHAVYIIILVLALSLYGGCSSSQSSSSPENYRYGTQALDMQWKSSPQQVYIHDDLILLLQLSNKGVADITDGQLYLSGFDPYYLDFSVEPSPSFELDGKSQFDPTGAFSEIYTFKASNVKGPKNVGQFPQSIIATACYTYKTTAVASICVDSDPYNKITRQKACHTGSVSVGGQGSPVVVSSIEPIISKTDIRLNLRIQNSGNGVVFYPSAMSRCGDGLEYSDVDYITPPRVLLGGIALDCSPTSKVWLNKGAALVSCVCENCVDQSVPAYQTTAEIDFNYGYRNSVSTQVTIVNDE